MEGCGGLEKTDLTVSTMGGCGDLERTVLTISTMEGCGGLERTDFNSFYYGRVWWY